MGGKKITRECLKCTVRKSLKALCGGFETALLALLGPELEATEVGFHSPLLMVPWVPSHRGLKAGRTGIGEAAPGSPGCTWGWVAALGMEKGKARISLSLLSSSCQKVASLSVPSPGRVHCRAGFSESFLGAWCRAQGQGSLDFVWS